MTVTPLRPGRTYCTAVTSPECQAPAGYGTSAGTARLPGVRKDDLLTCAYCGEPVCGPCSRFVRPPVFLRDPASVPVCREHPDEDLSVWRGDDLALSPPGSGLEGLAADVDAAAALEQTSTDGLLRAFASLTHQIDAAHREREDARGAAGYARRHNAIADLRAQRDLVRAEILRRAGDL